MKEPARAERTARLEERILRRMYLRDLRRFGEAQKLLLSFFFLSTDLNPLVTFLTIFVRKTFHVSNGRAYFVYIAIILAVAGLFIDHFGYRSIFAVQMIMMVIAHNRRTVDGAWTVRRLW